MPCSREPVHETPEIHFAKSIAADMERLSELGNNLVKHEIRNIIFRQQMSEMDSAMNIDRNYQLNNLDWRRCQIGGLTHTSHNYVLSTRDFTQGA